MQITVYLLPSSFLLDMDFMAIFRKPVVYTKKQTALFALWLLLHEKHGKKGRYIDYHYNIYISFYLLYIYIIISLFRVFWITTVKIHSNNTFTTVPVDPIHSQQSNPKNHQSRVILDFRLLLLKVFHRFSKPQPIANWIGPEFHGVSSKLKMGG